MVNSPLIRPYFLGKRGHWGGTLITANTQHLEPPSFVEGLGGCGRTLHQVLGSHGFLGRNLGRGVGSLEPGIDEEIDPINPMGRFTYIYRSMNG